MAVYAIPTNRPFVAKAGTIKTKRKVTESEKRRREFFRTHEIIAYRDAQGKPVVQVREK